MEATRHQVSLGVRPPNRNRAATTHKETTKTKVAYNQTRIDWSAGTVSFGLGRDSTSIAANAFFEVRERSGIVYSRST
jgi:hypothetical protein